MDCELLDWNAAGLRLPSTVRMLLATIASSRVALRIGRLTDRDWAKVQAQVQQVFTWP